MGMFDHVIIEGLKLPKLPAEINTFLKANDAALPSDFQTKDLDNTLSTYTIRENGQIYLTEYVPTGKKVPYEPLWKSFLDNRSFLERVYSNFKYGHYKYKPKSNLVEERKAIQTKVKLTDTFDAYMYHEVAGRYLEAEYEFTVTNGKVTKVRLLKAELEAEAVANKRKADDAELKAKMDASFEARRIFKSKWYYPVLKEIYNPFVFFSKIIIQALCNKIISWSHRWHGV
ncbi:MAG: hypothetical protein EBU90_20640 [Proteobacteria bacterium]|nr:hypothetical protein [Pseudomonadota bacterium]NBP15459.1 hypothetical protein [bacterium]